ncbi:hypothetical protein V3C99_012828 [Haemonchus contortus]
MLAIAMSLMATTVLSAYMYCAKKKPKEMTPSMRSVSLPPEGTQPPSTGRSQGSITNPSSDVKQAEEAPPANK